MNHMTLSFFYFFLLFFGVLALFRDLFADSFIHSLR